MPISSETQQNMYIVSNERLFFLDERVKLAYRIVPRSLKGKGKTA